ncbi:MAG: 1-deoxy-D-xylulose-5-phosphate synthase [Lachnospiraceae bacterium]|nr:1-deoxy-D-xylulose-5-phosphate synthase [Lachnospiraceae bacterium]
MLLDEIKKENDIKKIAPENYDRLAAEIRTFLTEKISATGGHLASNLGAVELTMALHLALTLPEDKIVWDVGHQAYTHKLLTGRREGFEHLRSYGGMSGFPKRRESECDSFNVGHSSTSISAGLGLAEGDRLADRDGLVAVVIGDGALTGGLALEALNNVSEHKGPFLIVLNDNKMSIAKNVGGLSRYLSNLRGSTAYNDLKVGVENKLHGIPKYGDRMVRQLKRMKDNLKKMFVPGMFFEDLGITYLGPIDGHDVAGMTRIFSSAKNIDHPVLVHVITEKGRGYKYAEERPDKFHGVEAFDVKTGAPAKPKKDLTYTEVFSEKLLALGIKHPELAAITAAMPDGTGLKKFAKEFPERFYDVGIAEEHAVTFAAGLAAAGMHPVVAIYSSFLQRAYDEILHDVCIQNLPVIFAVDRAGLVGEDGETHQGVFDLSFLRSIPNMNIFAPKNGEELKRALMFAVDFAGPIAIRYPRGAVSRCFEEETAEIEFGRAEVLYAGRDVALLAVGSMVETAERVRQNLAAEGIRATLVNVRFVKPFDEELFTELAGTHTLFVTMEENVYNGGFGEGVARFVQSGRLAVEVLPVAIPNMFVEHGATGVLKKVTGIDPESVTKRVLERVREK